MAMSLALYSLSPTGRPRGHEELSLLLDQRTLCAAVERRWHWLCLRPRWGSVSFSATARALSGACPLEHSFRGSVRLRLRFKHARVVACVDAGTEAIPRPWNKRDGQ